MVKMNTCVRLDEKEKAYLEEIASRKGMSLSDYLREIVRNEMLKELALEGRLPEKLKSVVLQEVLK